MTRRRRGKNKPTFEPKQQKMKISSPNKNIIGGVILAIGAIPFSYVTFLDPGISIWLLFLGSFIMGVGVLILLSGFIKRKLWYSPIILLLALLFYFSFQKSQTDIFPASILDNPVSKVRILMKFKHSLQLDSLRTSEMRFIFRGIGGRLELKTEIFDVTDQKKPGRLQVFGAKAVIPNWFVSVTQNPYSVFHETSYMGIKKLLDDGLAFELKLDGNTPLPFRVFRDFKGMFFNPLLSKDVVSILKEIIIEVNGQTILRGEASKVKWTEIQYFEEKKELRLFIPTEITPNPLPGIIPKELWQIDFLQM